MPGSTDRPPRPPTRSRKRAAKWPCMLEQDTSGTPPYPKNPTYLAVSAVTWLVDTVEMLAASTSPRPRARIGLREDAGADAAITTERLPDVVELVGAALDWMSPPSPCTVQGPLLALEARTGG